MSIRLRLALFFAAGTAVLYLVFGFVAIHQLGVGLDASVDSDLSRASHFIERALLVEAIDTRFADEPALETPSGFAPPHSHGSPVFGQLLDRRNQVVASVDLPAQKSLLSVDQLHAAETGPLYLDVTPPGAGGRIRVLAQPDPTLSTYVMAVGDPLGTGPDAQHGVAIALLILFGPVIALAAAAGWLLARASLRPVEAMRAQAEAISAHDEEVRLAIPKTRDELAGLATTMNDLLSRLHSALTRQKSFVSDAGHELRTPLAILQGELELASKPGRSPEELRLALGEAAIESRRLSQLAEDLLLLARGDEGHMSLRIERHSLGDVVQAAISRAGSAMGERSVELVVARETDQPIFVEADADRIQQAIGNLLDNALRYAPTGSTITVTMRTAPPAETTQPLHGEREYHAQATVDVTDAGPGFPPEYLPSAFERFQRPDEARTRGDGGAGLGLAIVRSIVESHGGSTGAENLPGAGARVWFSLPIM